MGGGKKIKRQKKMKKEKGKGKRREVVRLEKHWFGETECRF
jgi:hypothetical protein